MKELNDMIQDIDSGVKHNGDKLDQIIDNQGNFANFEFTTTWQNWSRTFTVCQPSEAPSVTSESSIKYEFTSGKKTIQVPSNTSTNPF